MQQLITDESTGPAHDPSRWAPGCGWHEYAWTMNWARSIHVALAQGYAPCPWCLRHACEGNSPAA